MLTKPKPPITSADVPDQWIADAKDAAKLDVAGFRAHPNLPAIQMLSPMGRWMNVMLPGSGILFTENSERNVVLRKLQGK